MNTVHLQGIDLNLLLAFHALLEHRHVTRAAASVGLTQSAMSHALGRLRTLFDDPLFVRTPRGMLATPRALELAEPIGRGLAQIEEAVSRRPSFDPKTARVTFRIGATDYGALTLLPGILARVLTDAPSADILVVQPADVPAAMESGAIDVMLVPALDLPGTYRQQVFTDTFVCVVRKDHPVVKRTLSLETYLSLPHALVAPRGRPGSMVDDILAKRGMLRRVVVVLPQFVVAPLLVAQSDVVLTVPARVAHAMAPMMPVRIVKCPLELPSIAFHQIWHERRHADPAHVWLRKVIAEVGATKLPKHAAS